MSTADAQIPPRSVEQLAVFLGVSKRTVYRGCKDPDPDRRWPHSVVAGKFRFSASQVERILAIQSAEDPAVAQDAQVVDLGRIVRAVRRRQVA